MDFDDNDEDYLPPPSACLFRSPKEPNLRAEYDLYRPSTSVRRLYSERNRRIFSEGFIENDRVGTLTNLCIEAIAKIGAIRNIPAIVRDDPLKMRLYYDSLDVDLPLKESYIVDDALYWRRVVLAKNSKPDLRLKQWHEYDWKSKGVSLKYVELVESCPAEYWPEKEMADLAALVKDNVKSMHIRRLQPLPATAFTQFVESDSEVDVTSSSSEIEDISSDEEDTDIDEMVEENGEEAEEESKEFVSRSSHDTYFYSSLDMVNQETRVLSNPDVDHQQVDRRNARRDRNVARQQLRNIQANRKAEHDRRRQRREMIRNMMKTKNKKQTVKKTTKREKKIKGVFDIPVEPELSDGEDKVPDKRNKDRMLRRIRRFDYPSEYCHHIDLSFVRHFDNLVSFHLEFLGPPGTVQDYHKRYIKFSFDDMSRLSKGLRTLEQLKIFRLRNSSVDRNQMLLLARALKTLNTLEEVDFGYDQMSDDCSVALSTLLERENMLKILQLEYNKLGRNSMEAIVFALGQHDGEGTLDSLGLAHNPITGFGLNALCRYLMDTQHVEKLNISAIEVSKEVVATEVSRLLRYHERLRHLEMAAIPLDPVFGSMLLRALKSNNDITYIDCRNCDLGLDVEFEIDILIRRNKFLLSNPYVGGSATCEEDICKYLMDRRHPIVEKVKKEQKQKAECLRNRIYQPTPKASTHEAIDSKRATEDYDIWAVLGVKSQLSRPSKTKSELKPAIEQPVSKPFVYDPNSFNMEQFRECVYQPGPSNRYYYMKDNRNL